MSANERKPNLKRAASTQSMIDNKNIDSAFLEQKSRYTSSGAANEIKRLEEAYDRVLRYIGYARDDYNKLKAFKGWDTYPESDPAAQKTHLDKYYLKDEKAWGVWKDMGDSMFSLWRDFEKLLDVAFRVFDIVPNFQKNMQGKYSHNYHQSRLEAVMMQSKIGNYFNQFCAPMFGDLKDARNSSKAEWDNLANMPTNFTMIRRIMERSHKGTMVLDTDFRDGATDLKKAVIAEINKRTDKDVVEQGNEKKQRN